jgi:hypothetical protein
MGKSISHVGLGRLMIKLHPEVKSKQERLISEWNKRERVFHGVQWRVEDNACSFEKFKIGIFCFSTISSSNWFTQIWYKMFPTVA